MPKQAHQQERCLAPHEVEADPRLDEFESDEDETVWEDLNGCAEWEREP